MMSPLYLELNRWGVTPWQWGVMDCMLALADWCVACGWPDPAADIRLTYEDRSSCQRQTGFLRDPLSITAKCFEQIAGLPVVAQAREGDIAVLKFGQYEHVGAVWTGGNGWASKAESSVLFYRPEVVPQVLRVWGMGYSGSPDSYEGGASP